MISSNSSNIHVEGAAVTHLPPSKLICMRQKGRQSRSASAVSMVVFSIKETWLQLRSALSVFMPVCVCLLSVCLCVSPSLHLHAALSPATSGCFNVCIQPLLSYY